jgi:hypothetical protein
LAAVRTRREPLSFFSAPCSGAPHTSTLCVMNETAEPTAKVLFRVPNEDGTVEVETLWAHDLGGDQYKLDNCPFYAYGVSLHDIVYAPHGPDEERATFQRVVSKSGNRTIRVTFDPPVVVGNESDKILQGLVALGCDYEGANPSYVVVNIPPSVALERIAEYLVKSKANWEHADPTYAELYPDDA